MKLSNIFTLSFLIIFLLFIVSYFLIFVNNKFIDKKKIKEHFFYHNPRKSCGIIPNNIYRSNINFKTQSSKNNRKTKNFKHLNSKIIKNQKKNLNENEIESYNHQNPNYENNYVEDDVDKIVDNKICTEWERVLPSHIPKPIEINY